MTKLEELKAAYEAAEADALDAIDAALDAIHAARADYEAACGAARAAYHAELKKTQEENSND
jgi:hypothetical protein